MPGPSLTKIACATAAAGVLVGHASAFTVSPNAAALRVGNSLNVHSLATSAQRTRHGDALLLRASTQKEQQQLEEDKFAISVDKNSWTVDPSGNSQVEVKGDFVEEGWSDDSASGGGGGGFFAGLFQKKPVKPLYGNTPAKSTSQLRAELDVIEYADGTKGSLDVAMKAGRAVPFGGLNPSQIDHYRKTKEEKLLELQKMPEGRFIMYPDRNGKMQRGPAPAQGGQVQASSAMNNAALLDGWYSAYDESSQSEYYYNDEGATTWERPVAK
eukprot:CAMPEP_0173389960 /NCGR_PEP_ID=MMETSP1356-20130122/14142_1 /TAXON_ID=77927 ORGANISM="Hemiselmis virescens, Strain PCC157" /NCGR_SAMPLE_ID=MMETSP1356 /ASSEMBLY_ACC=CAM_ASM_000847 /LENGTH=269 /DNA_ID=CAMNT_0014347261 /DNA_START=56 /DNA_END=865 /DNA_ORIENTATION=+